MQVVRRRNLLVIALCWTISCWNHQGGSATSLFETGIPIVEEDAIAVEAGEGDTAAAAEAKSSSSDAPPCRWGEPCNNNQSSSTEALPFVSLPSSTTTNSEITNTHHPHHQLHQPPEGFSLKARVYTDTQTNEAVLEQDPRVLLPYYDCGVLGSTTDTLPNDSAMIRQAISSTTPIRREGMPPPSQLLIALSPMEFELNPDAASLSSEDEDSDDDNENNVCVLQPGDVVLLEDAIPCEHICRPVEDELTMMILTLSSSKVSSGSSSSSNSRHTLFQRKSTPCPPEIYADGDKSRRRRPQEEQQLFLWLPPRKWVLGGIGTIVSFVLADFLGKVAPLWLSVGMGGTCFVVGGTVGFVQSTDPLCEQIQWWWRTRKNNTKKKKKTTAKKTISTTMTNENKGAKVQPESTIEAKDIQGGPQYKSEPSPTQ